MPQSTLFLFIAVGEDEPAAARSKAESQSTLTEKERSGRRSSRRCLNHQRRVVAKELLQLPKILFFFEFFLFKGGAFSSFRKKGGNLADGCSIWPERT